MKLVTFETSPRVLRLGALRADDEGRIIDLAAGAQAIGRGQAPALSSMLALIESGPAGLEIAREVCAAAGRAAAS